MGLLVVRLWVVVIILVLLRVEAPALKILSAFFPIVSSTLHRVAPLVPTPEGLWGGSVPVLMAILRVALLVSWVRLRRIAATRVMVTIPFMIRGIAPVYLSSPVT